MLILDRQPGQTIKIGDDIDVVFLGVFHGPNGPVARIGIGAPANVSVHREEIWLRIQRELEAQESSTQSTARSPARPDLDKSGQGGVPRAGKGRTVGPCG